MASRRLKKRNTVKVKMKRCCGDEINLFLPYERKNVVQTQAINSTAVLEKFNFNSKNIFCFQYPRLLSWFV